jgi:inorganic triphosphatase YgiF
MMAEAPSEIELKLALPVGRADEIAAVIPELAGAPKRDLSSTYFDTTAGVLRRAGVALRVRREGEVFTQTVKDAGDGAITCGEWEARVAGPAPDRAVLRGTPVAGLLPKGARLAPMFTVEVARRSADVVEGDSRIELSLDEGLVKAPGAEAAFAELELELKSGPQWGLFALARRLSSAADLTLSFTTKAERGADVARPPRSFSRKFEPPELVADMTAGEAFRRVAMACLRQIVGNAEQLRHRASPEVIHQLRVGLRRLRSVITSFKPVVADARLPAITAELRWLTGEFDAARNLDVLIHGDYRAAVAMKEDAEGLKGLGVHLRGARRIAYARSAASVESERFRRLMIDLLIWIEAGPWTASDAHAAERGQPIRRFAAKELAKRRRRIVKRGRKLRSLDAEARHKVRIEAKKLRYSADAFIDLFDHPKRAKSFFAALKEVQDALGDLNDIVVGERLAHEAAVGPGHAEADAAFVAGRIIGVQKARVGPLVDRAETAIEALGAVKPFWE